MNRALVAAALGLLALTGCEGQLDPASMTYEQFRATVFQEPETGLFIVDGDVPIHGEEALRAFFDAHFGPKEHDHIGESQHALSVDVVGGVDNIWADGTVLTYCVSDAFGARKAEVVQAMLEATQSWDLGGRVSFDHVSAEDANCTAANDAVIFDVRPVSNTSYYARAFFPNDPRSRRNILIDMPNLAWWSYSLRGLLEHEVGHTLGFRHEHIWRNDLTYPCSNESAWPARSVTAYDSASVMHYDMCGGTHGAVMRVSNLDREGMVALYGGDTDHGRPDHFAHPVEAAASFFDITGGWTNNSVYLRRVGDVNGDRIDDVVGFGHGGIAVYTGDGDGGLTHAPSFDYGGMFTYPTWSAEHPRFIADFDGDGRDDIIGFASHGVTVSLSNGSSFGAETTVLNNCGYNQGWRIGEHVRDVGDVDGDGRADVMCINGAAVYVALNNGSTLGALQQFTTQMTWDHERWTVAHHPRMLADVTGDGLADLVGFGGTHVFVAPSTGNAFGNKVANAIGFTTHSGNWFTDRHPRMMADVNGDGEADVVGFGDAGTHVSLSNGDGTFAAATEWYNGGGTNHGWQVNRHFRALGDLDGDGGADLLLSGEGAGVWAVFGTATP